MVAKMRCCIWTGVSNGLEARHQLTRVADTSAPGGLWWFALVARGPHRATPGSSAGSSSSSIPPSPPLCLGCRPPSCSDAGRFPPPRLPALPLSFATFIFRLESLGLPFSFSVLASCRALTMDSLRRIFAAFLYPAFFLLLSVQTAHSTHTFNWGFPTNVRRSLLLSQRSCLCLYSSSRPPLPNVNP